MVLAPYDEDGNEMTVLQVVVAGIETENLALPRILVK